MNNINDLTQAVNKLIDVSERNEKLLSRIANGIQPVAEKMKKEATKEKTARKFTASMYFDDLAAFKTEFEPTGNSNEYKTATEVRDTLFLCGMPKLSLMVIGQFLNYYFKDHMVHKKIKGTMHKVYKIREV